MVKTRIAPSPTGDPHIGTAYSALFNYAFAKKDKGKFVLRIEDTDQTRLVKDSENKILDSLKWLGLKWDEGPIRQSERLSLYQNAAKELIKNDKAYYCNCSQERLDLLRVQQQSRKEVPRYDKKCRISPPKKLKEGSYVVRLKVPETGETIFNDQIRGEIVFKNKDIDDGVILKSDGWPTYHLAVVVDDYHMKISHVIRAEEWLSSTPKHVLIYKALNLNIPFFIHLPLLRNKDKSKISKRKNPVSLDWYKSQGYLPEALLNYLSLMGWSMPDEKEKFSLEEFVKKFDIKRIDPAGPIFDLDKLDWLNGQWIRSLPKKELVQKARFYSKRKLSDIERLLPLVYERMRKLSELDPLTNFIFEDVKPNFSEVAKKYDENTKRLVLEKIGRKLENVGSWTSREIEKKVESVRTDLGWTKSDLYMVLRVAVSGSTISPPLFETMEVIGKNKTISRLR